MLSEDAKRFPSGARHQRLDRARAGFWNRVCTLWPAIF